MNQKPNVSSSAGSATSGSTQPSARRDDAARTPTSHAGNDKLSREVKDIAGEVAGEARKSAETHVSSVKDRAARSLGDVADALRQAGQQLRAQDKTGLTDYVVRAATQVDAASDYLSDRSLNQVVGDVENFARREPMLFIGGAFVVGLVGGRFLKSSRSDASARSDQERGAPQTGRGSQGRMGSDSAPNGGASGNGGITEKVPV